MGDTGLVVARSVALVGRILELAPVGPWLDSGSDTLLVLVGDDADERVADELTVPGDGMERFVHAASVHHCLPVGMVREGSAATGTDTRSSIVRDDAARTRFARADILDVDHPQFRLCRMEG